MSDNAAQAANAQENAANAATTQENASTATEGQDAAGKPTEAEAKLLKEVMTLKKQLKTYESGKEAAEKQALAEQGKFKELAEKEAARAQSLAQRAIKAELALHLPGLIKPDLIKLVDTAALKISDDGSIEGIEDVAAAFKAANPEYFRDAAPQVPGTPKPGAATPGAPASFQDWEKMPTEQRMAWAAKNPTAFERLCNAQKQSLTRR
jgi:hypothetical protein